MPVLITFGNSSTYKPFRLTARPVSLGRSSKADIQLKDQLCSGRHACLQLDQQGFVVLTDLNSTNGTFLNNVQVSTAMRVYVDDIITIGETKFWIEKSQLSPQELKTLSSGSNKTSFTQIELPDSKDSSVSMAKEARRKAIGQIDEQEAFESVESTPEIVVPQSAQKHDIKTVDDHSMLGVESVFELGDSTGHTRSIVIDKNLSRKTKAPPKPKKKQSEQASGGLLSKVKGLFKKD